VYSVGQYCIVSNADQFTAGTGVGYQPVLQVTSATFAGGSYTLQFNKSDGGSVTSVSTLPDIYLPTGFDFVGNAVSMSQVSNGDLYGKPGMSFNTYGTVTTGTVTSVINNTRQMYFDTDALNVLTSNNEVVDMNIQGTSRQGTADTPYYRVNGLGVLNPNNLIIDTTFATNSAIYLNASSTNTQALGTWRMKVATNGRIVFQMMKSNGNWTQAFSIAPP
jgi:hypothetical protein